MIDQGRGGEPRADVLRLLRDRVRYVDRVWELAAIAIAYLKPFEYSGLHIRRNEFQYTQTRLPASASLTNVRELLVRGQTVYMATDETSPAFLAAWRAEFRVVTWRDLLVVGGPLHGLEIPRMLVGLVEQAICSMSARFFGTRYSTFSSYIVRLRGFMGAPDTRSYYHTQAYTFQGKSQRDTEIARLQPVVHGQEYMSEHPAFWTLVLPRVRNSRDTFEEAMKDAQVTEAAAANKWLHFVWSTDCSHWQQWQSVTLLYSARLVKQEGRFTRIVSGCRDEAERAAMRRIHTGPLEVETYFARSGTGSTAEGGAGGKFRYKQQNRPEGLLQWLREPNCHLARCVNDEETLVVLDPDQAFIKPLSNRLEDVRDAALQLWPADNPIASLGHPVAQGYDIASYRRFLDVCVRYFGHHNVSDSEGCQHWQMDKVGTPALSPPLTAPNLGPASAPACSMTWLRLLLCAGPRTQRLSSPLNRCALHHCSFGYAQACAALGRSDAARVCEDETNRGGHVRLRDGGSSSAASAHSRGAHATLESNHRGHADMAKSVCYGS